MLFFTLLSACCASVVTAKPPQIRTLGQLAHGTWFENIALRPNGDILATQLLREPNIWTVRRPESRNTTLELVATLPFGNAAVGITHVHNIDGLESYVIAGGNFSDGQSPAAGEYTVYTLQFSGKHSDQSRLRTIGALGPCSVSANGITSSDAYPGIVFIADTFTGLIGRLDVSTGRFEQGLWSYRELRAPPGFKVGINGIKVHQSHLYWTNSNLVAVYKVPITASGYPVPGAVPQLVANLSSVASIVDDFAIDSRGNVYSATNLDNTVVFSDAQTGRSKIVAGGLKDFAIEGVSALAVARERRGEVLLYGVTSGGLEHPINGISEGAKVSAITLTMGPWRGCDRD